ncbi:FadR/GntR family transcriptional regulator [Patulibacter defluvii]|uniref:FadR/GntR family transcriptional regulator n=1 Tax=Patulibacter defluvii TaxID=3095358 RepID=UPI002A74E6F3|nr:FCD domain-containing protein [Patulibacter sp. DM4]
MLSEHPVLTAPQQLRARLEELVLDGTLAAGDALPRVDVIAEQFGVSTPTAQIALRALRDDGALSVTRGRHGGYRVTRDAIAVAREQHRRAAARGGAGQRTDYATLLELRRSQEVLTARFAANHRTARELDHLAAALPAAEGLPESVEEAFDLDLRFHRLLAECTHDAFLVRATRETVKALRGLGPGRSALGPADVVVALDGVLDAVDRRDPAAAAHAMRRHLRRSSDFFAPDPGGPR